MKMGIKMAMGLILISTMIHLGCSEAKFGGTIGRQPTSFSEDGITDESDQLGQERDISGSGTGIDGDGTGIDGDGTGDRTGDGTGGGGIDVSNGSISKKLFKLVGPRTEDVVLDIVWFVDNSPSLKEEVQNVNDNISNFVEIVTEDRPDVNIIVVNDTSNPETGIKLPENFSDIGDLLSIDPGERSMLATAASAICPASSSSLTFKDLDGVALSNSGKRAKFDAGLDCTIQLCGQDILVPQCNTTDFGGKPTDASQPAKKLFEYSRASEFKGKANGLLRENSKKVFVFVSDDDSTVVDDTNFLKIIAPYIGARQPVIYAFTAVEGETVDNGDTCRLWNYGRSYKALAGSTGGNVLNICNNNWSAEFNNLASKLTEDLPAETIYGLGASGVSKINKVTVDGVVIDASLYRLVDDDKIAIDESIVLANDDKDIEIEFVR